MATPDRMMSAVRESMTGRTGRSLEQWVALVALGDDVTVEGRGTYVPDQNG